MAATPLPHPWEGRPNTREAGHVSKKILYLRCWQRFQLSKHCENRTKCNQTWVLPFVGSLGNSNGCWRLALSLSSAWSWHHFLTSLNLSFLIYPHDFCFQFHLIFSDGRDDDLHQNYCTHDHFLVRQIFGREITKCHHEMVLGRSE